MAPPVRPSGASVLVLKTFNSEEECLEQCRLMQAAPRHVALSPALVDRASYTLPLCNPHVPSSAFFDLLTTYIALWSAPKNPRAAVSLELYHEYVVSRLPPKEAMPGVAELFEKALKSEYAAYLPLKGARHVPDTKFTHGDAIVGNAVHTTGGVRLIDFSPRPTPGDPEIDVAKLIFSSLGFDLNGKRRKEFGSALKVFRAAGAFKPELIRYYLASHIVRVLSKEPPETLNRKQFYEGALNHVSQM